MILKENTDLDKLVGLEVEYRDNLGLIQDGKIVGYEYLEEGRTDLVFFMIELPYSPSNIYRDMFKDRMVSFGDQVISDNVYLPDDIEL